MKVPQHLLRIGRRAATLSALVALGGCSLTHGLLLMRPHGPVASAELHYLVLDLVTMLFVIVPALGLAVWVLWRYRSTRRAARAPGWTHSGRIEALVWGVPLLVVGVLSYFSYQGVHAVDPYGPDVLRGTAAAGALRPASLQVDVIATDWQWLFVYPRWHIASANELVVPTGMPVHFRLTSASVTDDFFIPQLVGQIYAMPGMRTRQAMLVTRAGEYRGFSAEFSGPGFSWMDFHVEALPRPRFARWVARARHARRTMSFRDFARFARPTVNLDGRVTHYAAVQPGLFRHVIAAARAGRTDPTPYTLTENMDSRLFREHRG